MTSPTRNPSKSAFLPVGVSDFLRRRRVEGLGGLGVLVGAATVLALISYNSEDPSLNTAVAGGVRNWLGAPGAPGCTIGGPVPTPVVRHDVVPATARRSRSL